MEEMRTMVSGLRRPCRKGKLVKEGGEPLQIVSVRLDGCGDYRFTALFWWRLIGLPLYSFFQGWVAYIGVLRDVTANDEQGHATAAIIGVWSGMCKGAVCFPPIIHYGL